MGRSPCCDKEGLKKGPWTPEEDQKLLAYIQENGHGRWRALPAKAGLQRCGKSCRLRWTNYLRPDIKRGKFSLQEEQTIIQLHALLGNRWSAIARHLPKRTDNEIKNYWNTCIKKRLNKMGIDPVTHMPKSKASGTTAQSKDATNISHLAQWESARLQAEARLVRESKLLSKSFQSQIGRVPPTSALAQRLNKAATMPLTPPCLDVFKVWQEVWSNSTAKYNANVFGTSLESPTSTLCFPEGKLTNSAALDFCDDWKNQQVSSSFAEIKERTKEAVPHVEFQEQTTQPGESLPAMASFGIPNIMEGLASILLENVDCHTAANANGNVDSEVGNCSGYIGEGTNYWDSLLNLVSSPPFESPVF